MYATITSIRLKGKGIIAKGEAVKVLTCIDR